MRRYTLCVRWGFDAELTLRDAGSAFLDAFAKVEHESRQNGTELGPLTPEVLHAAAKSKIGEIQGFLTKKQKSACTQAKKLIQYPMRKIVANYFRRIEVMNKTELIAAVAEKAVSPGRIPKRQCLPRLKPSPKP